MLKKTMLKTIMTLSKSKSNRSRIDCQAGAFFSMYLWIKMKSRVDGRNQKRLQAARILSLSMADSKRLIKIGTWHFKIDA